MQKPECDLCDGEGFYLDMEDVERKCLHCSFETDDPMADCPFGELKEEFEAYEEQN